jgi:penicillin-binding protein 1A
MNLLRRILKRLFSSVVLASVTFVGAPVAFAATVLAGLVFLPLPASIPLPPPLPTVQPTVIYDRFGQPIAALQNSTLDLPFSESQVPADLKEAVISDEDRNFYHESGVDVRGLVRAALADLRSEAAVQGASTITEQYVKLAYTGSQRTLARKIRQTILASQLAREASKNDILYHYMTIIYLGDGLTGVESAAETYFHVPVQNLDPSEAATLAGLIPAPSLRAPDQNLAAAESARELVLKEMYQQHYLTLVEYQHWLSLKLALAGTPQAVAGQTTIVYPKVVTITTPYPDFVDYVERWMQANLPESVIAQGGLRIQTTLDPAVQQDAYAAVDASLDGSAFPVDMALAAVEPSTGFVDALVAGRGFTLNPGAPDDENDNLALGGCYDPLTDPAYRGVKIQVSVPASCWSGSMITGGGGGRQPGSSYKPFTLVTAFEQGVLPTATYPAPYIYNIPKSDGNCQVGPGNPCTIRNDTVTSGVQNLATAIADSTNTVFAQVAEQVGCQNVAETAKKMGIETAYLSTPPIYSCASYSLGEIGVTPLDMASAYGVLANHGRRAAPTPILEIVDSQGHVLVDNIHQPPAAPQVIPANVADNATNLMQGVLQFGTAAGRGIGRPAAGKTGTTNNNTDAWFVGFTPTLSTAVWMGNVNSDSTPVGQSPACPGGCVTGHFLGGGAATFYGIYGADWPAITWQEFMEKALTGVPVTPFSAPAPIETPQEAAALQAQSSSTTVPVRPGLPQPVAATPTGGPYVYPALPPVAPPPVIPTTTTTLPADTTPNPTQPAGGTSSSSVPSGP